MEAAISREVYLPETDGSMAAYLGKVAVKESGVKFSSAKDNGRGFIHLSSKVRYNQGKREYMLGGKNVKGVVKGNSVMFAPSDEIAGSRCFRFSSLSKRVKYSGGAA
ncbi:MAG: hypothetical protein M0C28_20585 [Candidatus Moduliflexus flocculans]|nr:hypothetical protein [Candidatus Moduliflexus flocculans]